MRFAAGHWRRPVEMIRWAERKDIDGDGLIERSGPSAVFATDATWMDTEDRSGKPIELQALHARSLESASGLANLLGMRLESEE